LWDGTRRIQLLSFNINPAGCEIYRNKNRGVLVDTHRREIHCQSEALKMDEAGIRITSYLFLPSEAHRTWRS
jgi:hypothetical protein